MGFGLYTARPIAGTYGREVELDTKSPGRTAHVIPLIRTHRTFHLALPRNISRWPQTTVREKLIKIGAKVVEHAQIQERPWVVRSYLGNLGLALAKSVRGSQSYETRSMLCNSLRARDEQEDGV